MIFFSELLLTVLLANPLPALCVGILGTLLGLFVPLCRHGSAILCRGGILSL